MRRYDTAKSVLNDELKILNNALTNLLGESNKKMRESNNCKDAAESVKKKINAIKTVLEHLNGGK